MNSAHSQLIIGHRGASQDAPENTLSSFAEAWRQRADGIEGDFYFTHDKQIVCIHDKDTQRTAGKQLIVADSTLSQLRELEYGSWKGPQFRGESLPTFQQVLQSIPQGKHFVVELKTGPQIVPLLVEALADSHFETSRMLIISFDEATVTSAKQLLPHIKAHWLTSYKRNAIGQWKPEVPEIARTLKRTGADGLGTKADPNIVNEAFIRQLRDQGMQEFHVWTVDDAQEANYFQRLGAVAITTNRPAYIRRSLRISD